MVQLNLEDKYKELQETEEGKRRSAEALLRIYNLSNDLDERANNIIGNTLTKNALTDAAKRIRGILALL